MNITYGTNWCEAFAKFGNADGDDPDAERNTERVADVIRKLGYVCKVWGGIHNVMIVSIIDADGVDIIEEESVGYDDPRRYLPQDILDQLRETFNEDDEEFFE
tara:strand:- start:218 stop:526 length:309 start_codon:yes stop_codon:yes gene_type:complete